MMIGPGDGPVHEGKVRATRSSLIEPVPPDSVGEVPRHLPLPRHDRHGILAAHDRLANGRAAEAVIEARDRDAQ